jgi:hypothetical protein
MTFLFLGVSTGTLAPLDRTVQSRPAVLFAIARFEARKIWRHPALLVVVFITVYRLYQQVDWSSAPLLNRVSYTFAWPMVIFAAGVYLTIVMTVNRRHGTQEETLDALPASSVEYFRREAMVALELDQLPRSDVAEIVSDRWGELTNPQTITDDIAGWFGVEVPEMGSVFESGTVACP